MSRWMLALLVCLSSPVGARAAADLSDFGFHQRPGALVPMDAVFHDETGRPLRFGDLIDGQPVILALGYFHCPNLCGIVRADLFDALGASGLRADQYSLIALSIDPAETSSDAATAKREDMARYPVTGADHAWHYLTGSQAAVQRVAEAVGFSNRYDAVLKQFLHPTGLVFLAPAGRVSGYLLGVGYSPGDLTSGVARARSGAVGQAAVPVLLLCFHFDPSTGRYTLAVTKVLQIAGLFTVLTVGGMIGLALRRDRTR